MLIEKEKKLNTFASTTIEFISGVTIMLSVTIFATIVGDMLPVSDATPLIGLKTRLHWYQLDPALRLRQQRDLTYLCPFFEYQSFMKNRSPGQLKMSLLRRTVTQKHRVKFLICSTAVAAKFQTLYKIRAKLTEIGMRPAGWISWFFAWFENQIFYSTCNRVHIVWLV